MSSDYTLWHESGHEGLNTLSKTNCYGDQNSGDGLGLQLKLRSLYETRGDSLPSLFVRKNT